MADQPLTPEPPTLHLPRRRFLVTSGAALLLAACGKRAAGSTQPAVSSTTAAGAATTATSAASTTSTTALAGGALTATAFDGLGTCLLLPEKTAGPYPLEEQFIRRDVTEGMAGHPVRLGLRVLDQACAPVPGAAVEIWHADATGDYSAYADGGGGKDEGPGTTFLRGTQVADDAGIVEFLTIYPGWYAGRAVHIHLRVHLEDTTVLTSQLFFDEAYTEAVYASGLYAENGLPDTSLAEDNIAGDAAAEGTMPTLVAGETTRGRGTLALLNLGIDPGASSTGGGPGAGGGPGGAGGGPGGAGARP